MLTGTTFLRTTNAHSLIHTLQHYHLSVCSNWSIIQWSIIPYLDSVFGVCCTVFIQPAVHYIFHSGCLRLNTFVTLSELFEITSKVISCFIQSSSWSDVSGLTDFCCCLRCCCQSLHQTLLQCHLEWAHWYFLSDCPGSDRCWQWIRCWCEQGWGKPHVASCSSVGCVGERIRYQVHGAPFDYNSLQQGSCADFFF